MPAETVLLDTIDGLALAGELTVPPGAWGALVVCHPHPLYGGTMDDPVVRAVVAAGVAAGLAAVRFDFRGVRRSQGEHAGGELERFDVVAAIEAVAPAAGDGPLVVVGYSFGALVALSVVDPRLAGWVGVAPPLTMTGGTPLAAHDHRPKHLLVPAHDQFTPPEAARAAVTGWAATTVEEVAMADHFLGGRTAAVGEAAVGFVASQR